MRVSRALTTTPSTRVATRAPKTHAEPSRSRRRTDLRVNAGVSLPVAIAVERPPRRLGGLPDAGDLGAIEPTLPCRGRLRAVASMRRGVGGHLGVSGARMLPHHPLGLV